MDFIAIDFETADSANTAPCSMGIAIVIENEIREVKHYLINPEKDFNPMAMRIHKITPEMVEHCPTFPAVWEEVVPLFSKYPVVAHNAPYDLSVLGKAANRYGISLPKISYYCTLAMAQSMIQGLSRFKLKDVCSALNITPGRSHHSGDDAVACAHIFLALCPSGDFPAQIASAVLPGRNTLSFELDDFQDNFLHKVSEILAEAQLKTDLFGFRIQGSNLDLGYFYRVLRLGKMKKGYFVEAAHEEAGDVPDEFRQEATKSVHRIFIDDMEALRSLSPFILRRYKDALNRWEEYTSMVQPKTVQKHIKEYSSSHCLWLDYCRNR